MNKIRKTTSDWVFDAVIVTLIVLVMLLCLYPLIYVVSASFSDPMAIVNGSVWLTPVRPSLNAYKSVFKNPDIVRGYANAILYTVVGTAVMDQILLSEGIKYAVIVAASLPMMLLYPFLQKYFSKGVMVGAVKG